MPVRSDDFLSFQIFDARFEFYDELDWSEALEYPWYTGQELPKLQTRLLTLLVPNVRLIAEIVTELP